ncbi:Amylovoran biosynthesis glycosyltransferase AmsE [Vibrio crassostreae]|nr:Amylovoran biosynthesis glycosyltransferase AmsE [Vibrio crassostreae]CAK2323512.1 Amylovoran biosynthesis glycosyltransferase AmsE [Vibrio crassostreae]CAK2450948.1 Amylovoran biosynthesis glycosyltransferase AmsE [Vibrio crassostreae]CAK2771857.1 Amylovoran biosynthesis glycosyltransferase AmsE [Vibrio crassostreae]
MTSKFSVLCSLYYKEEPAYLEQCFDSLAWQTLEANEIVVVHDGPLNSGLYDVLATWKKKLPIKEVMLPENVGLGEALNAGLKECSYELIARVDTDDINHIDRFKKQIGYMDENIDISALSCDINEFETSPEQPSRVRQVPKHDITSYSLRRNPINHMAAVFRKSAIIKVGSYKHLHFMEDYYLWVRLQAKGYKLANLSETLVSARVGNGMLERRKGLNYAKSELKIMYIMYKLQLAKTPSTFFYFLMRASLRLLPASMLSKVYRLIRKIT